MRSTSKNMEPLGIFGLVFSGLYALARFVLQRRMAGLDCIAPGATRRDKSRVPDFPQVARVPLDEKHADLFEPDLLA